MKKILEYLKYFPLVSIFFWVRERIYWKSEKKNMVKAINGSDAFFKILKEIGFGMDYPSGVLSVIQKLDPDISSDEQAKRRVYSRLKNILFPKLEQLTLLDSVSISTEIVDKILIIRIVPPHLQSCNYWFRIAAISNGILLGVLILSIIIFKYT